MNAVGIHLMLELKECNPELLDDVTYVKDAMTQAAHEVGAHIIGSPFTNSARMALQACLPSLSPTCASTRGLSLATPPLTSSLVEHPSSHGKPHRFS